MVEHTKQQYHHAFPWDYSASEHGPLEAFNPATAFINICAYFGLAYDLRKPDSRIVQKRVERTGDIHSKQKFYSFNVLLDYLLGFTVSYFLLLFTWALRYLINGKF